jgi:hypothetical protein
MIEMLVISQMLYAWRLSVFEFACSFYTTASHLQADGHSLCPAKAWLNALSWHSQSSTGFSYIVRKRLKLFSFGAIEMLHASQPPLAVSCWRSVTLPSPVRHDRPSSFSRRASDPGLLKSPMHLAHHCHHRRRCHRRSRCRKPPSRYPAFRSHSADPAT